MLCWLVICFKILNFRAKKTKKTMIWFSIDIVVWFLHGDWNKSKMSMLLRKELESLELTYPDETSPVLSSTETNSTLASTKVFMKRKSFESFEWCVNPFFFQILKANSAIAQWRSHTASQWEKGETFYAARDYRWRARFNGYHHQWSIVVSNHSSAAIFTTYTRSAHTKFNSNIVRSLESN